MLKIQPVIDISHSNNLLISVTFYKPSEENTIARYLLR